LGKKKLDDDDDDVEMIQDDDNFEDIIHHVGKPARNWDAQARAKYALGGEIVTVDIKPLEAKPQVWRKKVKDEESKEIEAVGKSLGVDAAGSGSLLERIMKKAKDRDSVGATGTSQKTLFDFMSSAEPKSVPTGSSLKTLDSILGARKPIADSPESVPKKKPSPKRASPKKKYSSSVEEASVVYSDDDESVLSDDSDSSSDSDDSDSSSDRDDSDSSTSSYKGKKKIAVAKRKKSTTTDEESSPRKPAAKKRAAAPKSAKKYLSSSSSDVSDSYDDDDDSDY
jgi:hypothetical protein